MSNELHGMRIAVLVANGFEQSEMEEPRKALETAGAKVDLISPETSKVKAWQHTLTSWPSLKKDLVNAGATWVDQVVVRDQKLVTSRKPDDLPEFNKEMIQLFSER
jgi:putative intracellular protease/amidase